MPSELAAALKGLITQVKAEVDQMDYAAELGDWVEVAACAQVIRGDVSLAFEGARKLYDMDKMAKVLV